MFTPAQKSRLVALEARLDQKLFGMHRDPNTGAMVDDDSALGGVAKTAAVAGGVGAGVYGGYRADQAITDRMGGMNATRAAGAARATYGDAAKALGGEALEGVKAKGAGLMDWLKKLRGTPMARSAAQSSFAPVARTAAQAALKLSARDRLTRLAVAL